MISKSPTLIKDSETSIDEVAVGIKKDGWYVVTNPRKKVGIGFK